MLKQVTEFNAEMNACAESADVLTPEQIAERLQVGIRAVYKLCQTGRLPAFKLGAKSWRIRKSDYQNFLETSSKAGLER